jgi:molecular chaperone DnaK (HSP70)
MGWTHLISPTNKQKKQAGVELGATVDAFRAQEAERAAAAAAEAATPSESSSSKQPRRRRAAAPALRPKARPPVSRVLLVGAPTRAPGFRAFVRNLTGLEPEDGESGGVDPDAAVALGAAVQAAALDAGEATGQGITANGRAGGRDLVVLDVLQGALARALAAKALEEDEELADRVLGAVEGGGGGGGGRGRRKPKGSGGGRATQRG